MQVIITNLSWEWMRELTSIGQKCMRFKEMSGYNGLHSLMNLTGSH